MFRYLLVDIGNTRTKWVFAGARGFSEPVAADASGVDASLRRAHRDVPCIEGCFISCVGPGKHAQRIGELVLLLWSKEPTYVTTPKAACGIINGYSVPGSLGVDRWLAMLGAVRGKGAVCVVDAGTAMTIDGLDPTGRHLGGAISPGYRMMIDSLGVKTTNVHVSVQQQGGADTIFCRDTSSAVHAAAILALQGLAERGRLELVERYGSARAVITGGDAPLLAPRLQAGWEHDPLLVFRGMWRSAMENSTQ